MIYILLSPISFGFNAIGYYSLFLFQLTNWEDRLKANNNSEMYITQRLKFKIRFLCVQSLSLKIFYVSAFKTSAKQKKTPHKRPQGSIKPQEASTKKFKKSSAW